MVDDAISVLPAVVNILNEGRPEPALLTPPRTPDPPSIPRHVPVAVPPGPAPAIVIVAVPGLVVPTRAVNDGAVVFVGAEVAGRVAHFHFVIARLVNAREGRVVHRRTGRDGVNLFWHFRSHLPRPRGRRRRKPHTVVERVVSAAEENDWQLRIDSVAHARAFDGLELRLTIVRELDRGFAA